MASLIAQQWSVGCELRLKNTFFELVDATDQGSRLRSSSQPASVNLPAAPDGHVFVEAPAASTSNCSNVHGGFSSPCVLSLSCFVPQPSIQTQIQLLQDRQRLYSSQVEEEAKGKESSRCRRRQRCRLRRRLTRVGLDDDECQTPSLAADIPWSSCPKISKHDTESSSRSTDIGTESDDTSDSPSRDGEKATTVMLRNLPNNYTRNMLVALLDSPELGFSGQYDFFYLPMDFEKDASLGYCFVNLVSPALVPKFWKALDDFSGWEIPTKKKCIVAWSNPVQGLHANLEHYRNSSLMHPDVRDDYKPMMFKNGQRVPFPLPTKKIKQPRSKAHQVRPRL